MDKAPSGIPFFLNDIDIHSPFCGDLARLDFP